MMPTLCDLDLQIFQKLVIHLLNREIMSQLLLLKVNLVKENYFTEKKATSTSIVVEETTAGSVEELTEETNVVVTDPSMQKYVSTIGRTTKK